MVTVAQQAFFRYFRLSRTRQDDRGRRFFALLPSGRTQQDDKVLEGGEGELELLEAFNAHEITHKLENGKDGEDGKQAHEAIGKLFFRIFDVFGIPLRID